MNEEIIKAVIEIGNHPKFTRLVEQQVMQPLPLESWMVKRILLAFLLLMEELDGDPRNEV